MKKNNFFLVIGLAVIQLFSVPTMASHSISQYVIDHEITKSTGEEAQTKPELSEEELRATFQTVVSDIVKNRNHCIQNLDAESLKTSYNLKIKVSLWAYESEAQKIKYFKNWCDKQAIKFNRIESVVSFALIPQPSLIAI